MSGPTTITWGDGTPPQNGPERGTVPHAYAAPGTYTIHVCDADHPALCTDVPVTLPFPQGQLTLTATPDETDPALYHFTADGVVPPGATVDFDFGDGTTGRATATHGTAAIDHTYARNPMATTYTATATSGPENATVNVVVPAAAPVVDIVVDPADTTGMTAQLTVTSNSGDGPVTVDWGDSTTVIDPVTVGQTITHAYAAPGTYTVKTTSKADATAFDETEVTVPLNVPLNITATQDATDPALYHFQVTGADADTTTVDFGDGSAVATVETPAGTGTVDHTYTRA